MADDFLIRIIKPHLGRTHQGEGVPVAVCLASSYQDGTCAAADAVQTPTPGSKLRVNHFPILSFCASHAREHSYTYRRMERPPSSA